MRDLFSRLAPVLILGPAVLAADNTPAAIDLQGFDSAILEIGIGVGGIVFDGTNKIEFVLKHGETTTVANHVAVTAADVYLDSLGPTAIVNGIVRSLVAAHAAADVQKVGYVGGKRYLSLLADFGGTHATGTALYAALIKGNAWVKPT